MQMKATSYSLCMQIVYNDFSSQSIYILSVIEGDMNTVYKQIVPFTKQPYTNYEICFKHQILKHVLVGMHQY